MTRSTRLPDPRRIANLTRRQFGALGVAATAATTLPRIALADATPSHGISAFGDLKYPEGFAHFDYVNPDAPKGGIWSTGYSATFDSFNAYIIKGNPAVGMGLIYDSLMTGGGDEPDALYGLIAETAEVPEDRSWAAFNIREGARFHDGTPITAEDAVFTLETLKTKGHPYFRLLLQPVASAEAEGERRVRYTFAEGVPKRDLPMLVAGLPVFSKAHYTANDFEKSSLDPPLGNGAYKIGRFEPNRYVIFDRVTDYWAKDLPVNVGRYNFDVIRIDYFRDRSAAFEAFKAGQFLFNEEFTSKFWATAYESSSFPAVGRGDVIRRSIPDERPSGTQGFWFNLRRDVFKDPRVREAMALAFDFEWSNQRLFYDLYERTDSFFEGGPMEADGPPTPGEQAVLERFADQLDPAILTEPAYVPPKSDGSGRNRRNLRRAGKLLKEAGWEVVNGVRTKDGKELDVEFLIVSQGGFARIAQPFIKNLEQLGVKARIREVDHAQYKQRMDNYDFDIVTSRKSMSLTPGVELRDYFHSSAANSPGSDNTAGVQDPVVDALIEVIERAKDRETLTSAVKALDRVLRSMHIWIPQWSKASHHLAFWDVFGWPEGKPKYARGVEDTWWSDAEKLEKMRAAGKI